jgi:hypothetical protein
MNRKKLKKIFLNLSYLGIIFFLIFFRVITKSLICIWPYFFWKYFFENGLDFFKINEQGQLESKNLEDVLIERDFRQAYNLSYLLMNRLREKKFWRFWSYSSKKNYKSLFPRDSKTIWKRVKFDWSLHRGEQIKD